MLKLAARERNPYWLDLLPGVRIKIRPITVAAIIGARQAAPEALKTQNDQEIFAGSAAFTRSIARWGITEWEGVGDADGTPVSPSPENIDALLELWQAFDAIDQLYIAPALIGAQEKTHPRPRRAACTQACSGCLYLEHAPQTDYGKAAWEVFRRSAGQVRAVMGGVYGLDFGAVLLLADAMGALNPVLVDALPEIEPLIVRAYRRDPEP
jgi:hypothetical protein